jgi:hypothetical protein
MAQHVANNPADLMADLHGLVQAGLLVELRAPGEPSRYALSAKGEELASTRLIGAAEASVGPEPCGAMEGFDGGARCRSCHVAWSPDM